MSLAIDKAGITLGSKMKGLVTRVEEEASTQDHSRFIPVEEDVTSISELSRKLNDAEKRWATAHKQLCEEVANIHADFAKRSKEDMEHLSSDLAEVRKELPKISANDSKIVLDDEVEAVLREEMALQSRELCAKLRSELQSEITARVGAAEKYAIDSFKKQFGTGVQSALNEVTLNIKKLQSSQALSNSLSERVVNLERQLTDTTCLVTSLASRALEDSSTSAVQKITTAIQEESSRVSTHTKEAVQMAIQGALSSKTGSADLPAGHQITGSDPRQLSVPGSSPPSLTSTLQHQLPYQTDSLLDSIQTIDKHRSETPNSRQSVITPPGWGPRPSLVPLVFPSNAAWTENYSICTPRDPTKGRPASPTNRSGSVTVTRHVARQISGGTTLVDTRRSLGGSVGGSMTLRVPTTDAPQTAGPGVKVQVVRQHSPGTVQAVRGHSPGTVRTVQTHSPVDLTRSMRTQSPGASMSMPMPSPGASVCLPVPSHGTSVSISVQSPGASVQVPVDAPSVGSSIRAVGASMVQIAAPEGSNVKVPTLQVLPDPSTGSSTAQAQPSPPASPRLMQAPASPHVTPRVVQVVPSQPPNQVAGSSAGAPASASRVVQPLNLPPRVGIAPPPSPGNSYRVIHIGAPHARRLSG